MTAQRSKILLVEDDAMSVLGMRIAITRAGYALCTLASSGEEAIQIAEREQPDLILTDIHLSGKLDGIEAARMIRTFCAVPLVFITGQEDDRSIERAEQLYPSGYMIKPVDVETLRSVIEAALQGRQHD